MTEEEIVKECCKLMGVKYSHYDNHMMSKDYFRRELSAIPKIVVYSTSHGHWQFSILEDMTIYTPISSHLKILSELRETIEGKGGDIRYSEQLKELDKERFQILETEKFLKENNCQEIINNPEKKINWV